MNDRITPDPDKDPYASYHPVEVPDPTGGTPAGPGGTPAGPGGSAVGPGGTGAGPEEPPTAEIPALRWRDTSDDTEVIPQVPASGDTTVLPSIIPAAWVEEPGQAPPERGRGGPSPLAIIALGVLVSAIILGLGFAVLGLGVGRDNGAAPVSSSRSTTPAQRSGGASTSKATSTTARTTRSSGASSSSRSTSSSTTTTSRSSTSSAPAVPERGLKEIPADAVICGSEVSGITVARGNDVTSCAFAQKVRQAAVARGKGDSQLAVRSPITGEIYQMSCTKGRVRVCTGGNGAIVYLK